MKLTRFYAVTAAALFTVTTAYAAEPAPQIATVNIQQIMATAAAAKSAREQLESKQKAFQAEINKKQESLQKEDQELSKQKGVLSKAAFEEKASAFRSKATDVQKDVQSKKALLDSAFEHAIAEIQKATTDIIADLAKEKGFQVALPTSQILYSAPQLDISDEVLKRLNQKLPTLDVKFDATSAGASK